jgi:zinc protease
MYKRLSAVLLVLPLVLAATFTEPVTDKTLSNGLRVIVKVDNRSPVVVSQLWYRVGSMDEVPGKTGLSHMLEHMMFKGTKTLKPGEFSKIIARNGGRENAFTTQNYTTYFQTLEKSRLPIALKLEADRMHNLQFKDEEFKHERAVVMEERRMRTEDKPEGRLYEAFLNEAYKVHPYGRPVIGSMHDIKNFTADDVRNWYHKWYLPNNATLVIVGDVKPKNVMKLAEKYFGPIPPGKLPQRHIPTEPPQHKTRSLVLKIPAKVPSILIGFHTPVIGQDKKAWEPYALDMLAGVLDGGDSARFSSQLVRKERIAASADAGYDSVSRAPSLFTISATPYNGRSMAELKKALLEQIDKLKQNLVTPEEMERIRAQVIASDVYQRDSMFYQGMEIGMLTTSGVDWHLADEYVKHIKQVTPQQIQAVARKYLVPENMSVAILQPVKDAMGKKGGRS